ncbi:ParB/RepB/Spo0J family partition protein [Nitratifractor sp.]|uniref:ParB/RepB/Spo0J family partition protein n=1 Tax=Nitratifractor sp. TaxID=2268144 RepID=UPI0025E3BA58|nr:ParB/RepB/Spo0J family partition protein [Nitratifractor sp.]
MALGKGLGAILEEVGQAYENELNEKELSESGLGEEVKELPVEGIDPNPYQPRKDFDPQRLEELGESIRRHGLLQPVVVIPHGDRWILVAGERRLRAHKLIGAETIRAIVADVDLDRLRMRELALVENIQRENLNPIELAQAYQELLDVHGITHEELAGIVHKSRSQITNTLRLLSLSGYARQALTEGRISQGHAKVLLALPEEKQRILVDTIVGRKLSVRETETLVKQTREGKPQQRTDRTPPSLEADPTLLRQLEELLPFPHRMTRKGIEILLPNPQDLKALIDFLNKKNR